MVTQLTDEGGIKTGIKGNAELVARTLISVLTTSVEKRRTRNIAKYGHILLDDVGSSNEDSKEEEIKCIIKDKRGNICWTLKVQEGICMIFEGRWGNKPKSTQRFWVKEDEPAHSW